MTQHVPYNKMENNNAKNLSALDKTLQYVLTEKIHGTNSSCYVTFNSDGEYTIQHGKRTALVGKGEKFYNIQEVLKPYEETMVECAKHILYELGHDHCNKTVIFFGEIYGGHYNNSKSPGSMMVQKWMDYAPGNHFAGFDIVIKLSEDTEPFPISYTKFKESMETYNIPTVPEVMRGSLEELMKNYNPNKATSIVSKVLHNLNDVEKPECEGAVLRPLDSNNFENRLKWKAAKYCDRPPKKTFQQVKAEEQEFLNCLEYCNFNRLESVMSHHGSEFFMDPRKFGEIIKFVNQDIMKDIEVDYPKIYNDDKKKKKLWTSLSKKANPMIRKFIEEWLPEDASPEDRILRQEMRNKEASLDISSLRMKLDSIKNRVDTLSG